MSYSSVILSAAWKGTNSFVSMNEYGAWAFKVIVLSCIVLIISTDSEQKNFVFLPLSSTDSWVKASTNLMKLSSETTPFLELVYSCVATSELPTSFTAIVILILELSDIS